MKHDLESLAQSFPALRCAGAPVVVDIEEVEEKLSADNQVLDVIYAPDPFTRLPQSDVAVYLSDKVDPAIREFVATQLLTPNPDVKGVDDANSDILYDLIRGDDESVADYAVRIKGIVESDSVIREREARVQTKTEE